MEQFIIHVIAKMQYSSTWIAKNEFTLSIDSSIHSDGFRGHTPGVRPHLWTKISLISRGFSENVYIFGLVPPPKTSPGSSPVMCEEITIHG